MSWSGAPEYLVARQLGSACRGAKCVAAPWSPHDPEREPVRGDHAVSISMGGDLLAYIGQKVEAVARYV
jgi:hypothetical protein